MCGTAAPLVVDVLPDVPVRQWVLTTPFPVRRVLALRPDALTTANRLNASEIARWQKQKATERGTLGGETGSVTFVQRFDSTLGSFVHFHGVALDGVFTRQNGPEVVFHQGPAPSRDDIATVAARVEERLMRWRRRRELVDERPIEEQSNEAPELSPLESCMQLSLFGGVFVRLDEGGVPLAEPDDDRFRTRGKSAKSTSAAEVAGFNIHAGVTIRAGDREGSNGCATSASPPSRRRSPRPRTRRWRRREPPGLRLPARPERVLQADRCPRFDEREQRAGFQPFPRPPMPRQHRRAVTPSRSA